jgi:hypothetical protein
VSVLRNLKWPASLLLIGACYGTTASPQSTSAEVTLAAPDGATVESEPLRCWLKSTKTSVHMGEQFDVALTCAVVETARAAVVPDVAELEPAALEIAPFEVLRGRRHPDIKRGIWRYFQYEYTLRLITDGFFGEDIAIPPISLRYRVNLYGAGAAQEGLEKTYVLPQLPIRVVSLVPTIATDIRDSPRDTFARIAERRLAANAAHGVAGIFYSFAAVLVVLMALRAFGTVHRRRADRERSMSAAAIAAAARKSLRGLRNARARDGWSPALVTHALALARIAGALALERPVAQMAAGPDAVVEDGQVIAEHGVLRRRAVLLSAPLTPLALAAAEKRLARPDRGQLLADIRAGLLTFAEARYARTNAPSAAELDAALARIDKGLQRTRILTAWPVRAFAGARSGWRSRALTWAR